jgi:hypothetical protein
MAATPDVFLDLSRKRVVTIEPGGAYLCHNTGRNVVVVQEVISGETWEAFKDELKRIEPLDAIAQSFDG